MVGGEVGDHENKKKENKVIVMTITLTVMDFCKTLSSVLSGLDYAEH